MQLLQLAAVIRITAVGGTSGRQPLVGHMEFMSSFSFNPPLMDGWVTHGLDQYCEVFPNCSTTPPQLNFTLDAYQRYGIPALYSDLPSGWCPQHNPSCTRSGGIFVRRVGLALGWEAALETLVTTTILPHFGPGKAFRGVFIGVRTIQKLHRCRIRIPCVIHSSAHSHTVTPCALQ